MAEITINPANVTLSISRFSSSKTGNITWTKPTIPSGATITSINLTGFINSSGGTVTEIKVNNSVLTSTMFNVDLGTNIDTTSVPISAKKSGYTATTVSFEDMTYTVVYEEASSFTVTFKNEDGSVIKTEENVANGTYVKNIQPTVSREDYTFQGWYDEQGNEVKQVTSDLVLTAKFKKNPQVNLHQNEGGYIVYNNTNYEGNQIFKCSPREMFNITITPKEGYGIAYTIIQREGNNDPIKDIYAMSSSFNFSIDLSSSYDVTIQYELLTSVFNVTFKDYNNTILQSTNVTFGDSVTPPEVTTERLGYKFTGWSLDTSEPIVENTTFVAQYTKVPVYTVIQNEGGYCTCNDVRYEGGKTSSFNVDNGGNVEIKAFANDNYVIKYVVLENQVKMVDNGTGTTWSTTNQNVSTNILVEITYVSTTVTHTVTYKDYNGNILKTETVYSGDKTTPPNDPTRDNYEFTGWDKPLKNITEDTVITAKYSGSGAGSDINKLYIGDKLVKNIYIGDKVVNSIYIGDKQIF